MTINPIFWHELGLIYMHLWWSDDLPTWQGRCLEMPSVVQGFWSAQSHSDDDCHQNPWGFQCGDKPSQCKIDWNPLANILAMYDDGDTPSKFIMEFPFLNGSKRCKLQLLQWLWYLEREGCGVCSVWCAQRLDDAQLNFKHLFLHINSQQQFSFIPMYHFQRMLNLLSCFRLTGIYWE